MIKENIKISLDDIMILHGTDKSSICHGYSKPYEKYFESFRDNEITLLELGVGGENTQLGGASLKSWKHYFQNGKIFGIDIYDKKELDSDRLITFKGSQIDEVFLKNVINNIGSPDIIIDDASHINPYTIKSFQILFPLLKQGGLYIIEDLSCSYRNGFEGNANLQDIKPNTIMNYLFKMLHNIQEVFLAIPNFKQDSDFVGIEFVHFYKDIVFIKKK